jgi:hypothetical protein
LVDEAVQFEGGVEGDDGGVAEGERDAVAVGRDGGEGAGVDAVSNEPHAALGFQAMKLCMSSQSKPNSILGGGKLISERRFE